jgi:hypothetical protein
MARLFGPRSADTTGRDLGISNQRFAVNAEDVYNNSGGPRDTKIKICSIKM